MDFFSIVLALINSRAVSPHELSVKIKVSPNPHFVFFFGIRNLHGSLLG